MVDTDQLPHLDTILYKPERSFTSRVLGLAGL